MYTLQVTQYLQKLNVPHPTVYLRDVPSTHAFTFRGCSRGHCGGRRHGGIAAWPTMRVATARRPLRRTCRRVHPGCDRVGRESQQPVDPQVAAVPG